MQSRRVLLKSGLGLAATSIVPRHVLAAGPAPQLIGTKIRQDVEILKAAYTQLHPGLYRYATPSQMESRFRALEKSWSRDQSLELAYLSLSRFLASVKCGHSYANFYNQSDAVQKQLFADIPRLPFQFRWIDGQMVVTRNQSGIPGFSAGTLITRINAVPTRTILRNLLPTVRADGSNDAKRRALLELRAEDDWETFDIFFNLLYPGARRYRLETREADGSGGQIDLAPISLETRRLGKPNAAQARADGSIWKMDYRPDGTAILSMPDWALYNSKWDWQAWLDSRFAEIEARKIRALIVDVRGNEGGLDCGNAILSRMVDQSLSVTAVERRVRYRRIPSELEPFLDTWDPSFATLGEGAEDLGNGFFRLDGGPANTITPRGPRFKGKLIVLTDAQNSSATFQFARVVKTAKLGTIIGSPTGGNQRGINGGAFYFLRLPHSGLEVDLPLIGTYRSTPEPDAGLEPDFRVEVTAKDIAAGHDPVLERALSFAQGQR